MIDFSQNIDFLSYESGRVSVEKLVFISFYNALTVQQKVYEKTSNLFDAMFSKTMAVDELENLCFGLSYISDVADSAYSIKILEYKEKLSKENYDSDSKIDKKIKEFKLANFKLKLLASSVKKHGGINFEGKT